MTTIDRWSLLVLDSNLLIYSVEPLVGERAERANEIVDLAFSSGHLVTTSQIIGEFLRGTIRQKNRLRPIFTLRQATDWVEGLLQNSVYVHTTAHMVAEAMRGMLAHGLDTFDAQIWATARLNGIRTILTEDMPSAADIEGVRYINPLAVGFDPAVVGL